MSPFFYVFLSLTASPNSKIVSYPLICVSAQYSCFELWINHTRTISRYEKKDILDLPERHKISQAIKTNIFVHRKQKFPPLQMIIVQPTSIPYKPNAKKHFIGGTAPAFSTSLLRLSWEPYFLFYFVREPPPRFCVLQVSFTRHSTGFDRLFFFPFFSFIFFLFFCFLHFS